MTANFHAAESSVNAKKNPIASLKAVLGNKSRSKCANKCLTSAGNSSQETTHVMRVKDVQVYIYLLLQE